MKDSTQLYRHFDKDNKLLYVGISVDALDRLQSHRSQAFWFDKIRKITIEDYSTRKEALKAEREAAEKESPIYNISLTDKCKIRHERLSATLNQQPTDEDSLRKILNKFWTIESYKNNFRITYGLSNKRSIVVENMTREEIDNFDFFSVDDYFVTDSWNRLLPEISFICYLSNKNMRPNNKNHEAIENVVSYDCNEKKYLTESGKVFSFAKIAKNLNTNLVII